MIENAPLQYDHEAIAGDTYRVVVQLVDADGEPYDLTSVTGVCQVLSEVGGEVVLTPTVAVVSPATDGVLRWTAPYTETAELAPGVYPYGVRLTWADATRDTVFVGRLTVLPPRVT